jgi:hypothetical protein
MTRRIVSAVPSTPVDSESSELERLRAENERLRAVSAPKALTFKVSAKGAVSVYGLQRFPVTLYQEQWVRLLQVAPDLAQFLKDNRDRLTTKGEK